MSYKVTVIIPTYNSVEFLDSTIASIMNQSIGFENIELIIVDDYSTDNTQELINHYCEKYENIKTFESGKNRNARKSQKHRNSQFYSRIYNVY